MNYLSIIPQNDAKSNSAIAWAPYYIECYTENMTLAESVYHYYFTNRHLLSEDKRFHFATRTAAWTGAEESYELLREAKQYIAPGDTPLETLLRAIYEAPQTGRRNAHELRAPFFEKYPKLYGAHLTLFRVRHLKEVYGVDARQALFTVISKEELIELRDQLLADKEALKILSTFAINYCYLLNKVILETDEPLPLQAFLDLGADYDTTSIQQIQLLIYFYTHCIIGESNFYVRRIPAELVALYQAMLQKIEPLIRDNFNKVNLDNKLEFLVCARICEYQTHLAEQIYAECEQSVSPEGTFVIDIHNENIQSDRNDFVTSEHRNVLFIMSTTPYRPHSTLVA